MNILMVLDSYFDYYQMIKNCPSDSNVFYFETNLTKILFLLYRTEINLVIVDSMVLETPLDKLLSIINEYDKSILILPYNLAEKKISTEKYRVYCNFINLSALKMLDEDSDEVGEYKKFLDYFATECESEYESVLKRLFGALVSKPDRSAYLSELCEFIFGEVTEKHINTIYGYIHRLRDVLGDDKREPKIVVKVEKGKYRINLPPQVEIKRL